MTGLTVATVIGWAIAIGSAIVGWWRNRVLRRELRRARAEVETVPEKVLDLVVQGLGPPRNSQADESTDGSRLPVEVGFADVTGDGTGELLVAHGVGGHSSILKVFGKRDVFSDFELLGEMFNDTGAPFHARDFDGDGKLENTHDHERLG